MTRSSPPDLALYVMEGCGYCEDVRAAMGSLGLELEERDVRREPAHRAALVEARGRATVPVLRIRSDDGEDTWLPESVDIVAYLEERFGDGRRAPVSLQPYLKIAMWGLLLGGAVASEPLRSGLWTAACALAAARSGWLAARTGMWIHGAVAGAFAFGAISIALSALRVADLPWWWAALVVAIAALIPSMRRPRST